MLQKKWIAVALLALSSGFASVASAHEIELSHQLGAQKGAELAKLIERFNAQSKGDKIVLVDRAWSDPDPADMMIVAELDQDRFLRSQKIKPLWSVLSEAGVRPSVLPVPKMLVPSAFDRRNRTVALPLALSTPIVFFNKPALARVGVNVDSPPTTWLEWQTVMGKLEASGSECPFTVSQPVSVLLENTSAWHDAAIVKVDKKGHEEFAANGLVQVKHLAFLATWIKARYLNYAGRGSAAESRFSSGDCLVLAAPSSAMQGLQADAKFEIGVASLPYHDGTYGSPQNTWADGPNLWISAGKSKADYKVIAQFVAYFLNAQSQVEWTLGTGYLPLTKAGVLALQSDLLSDNVQGQRLAVAQLTGKPVTRNSVATDFGHRAGVRHILAEEMEFVFADKKSSKEALDNAVRRIRSGEDGCCKPINE